MDCPTGTSLVGCGSGGIFSGVCTDCTNTDLLSDELVKDKIEFFEDHPKHCAYRCQPGSTGDNCQSIKQEFGCLRGQYRDEYIQPMRSECLSCVNVLPQGSISLVEDGLGYTKNRLLEDGGFETVRLSESNTFESRILVDTETVDGSTTEFDVIYYPEYVAGAQFGPWQSNCETKIQRGLTPACSLYEGWPCLPRDPPVPEFPKYVFLKVPRVGYGAILRKNFYRYSITPFLEFSLRWCRTNLPEVDYPDLNVTVSLDGRSTTHSETGLQSVSYEQWQIMRGNLTLIGKEDCAPCTLVVTIKHSGPADHAFVALDEIDLRETTQNILQFETTSFSSGTYYV